MREGMEGWRDDGGMRQEEEEEDEGMGRDWGGMGEWMRDWKWEVGGNGKKSIPITEKNSNLLFISTIQPHSQLSNRIFHLL